MLKRGQIVLSVLGKFAVKKVHGHHTMVGASSCRYKSTEERR
jgi:hypothetical protein